MSVDQVDLKPNPRNTLIPNNNDYKLRLTMAVCENCTIISTHGSKTVEFPLYSVVIILSYWLWVFMWLLVF